MRPVAASVALLVLLVLGGCVASLPGEDEHRDAELQFAEAAEESGLEYHSTENDIGNGNDGVYVADFDRNLREDVLLLGDDEDGPALYRNTPDGFERSGQLPAVEGRVMSALWLDYDGDGWEDLLLFRRGGSPVLLENRAGTFRQTDAGLEDLEFRNPVGASAADVDGDGSLEVLVIQYGVWEEGAPIGWQSVFTEDTVDNGRPNALLQIEDGEFVRDDAAGIGPDERGAHWSLATTVRDLTGDGHPDVHVANDYYNDTLYVNRGDGTFERHTLGAATDRNGMSSTTADVTGDGTPELFVTNIYFPEERRSELTERQQQMFSNFVVARIGKRMKGNNLLTYAGDGEYEDVGGEYGVDDGGWGWGATFGDLDSDGDRDLFQATQDVIRFDRSAPKYSTPMVWLRGDERFHEQNATATGLELHDGRGVAGLDYQVDGARDVAVGTYEQPYRLYRNDADQGESLQVVVGGADDLGGTVLGTTVEVAAGGETQRRVHTTRADYQAQDTRVLHFGLGETESVEELRVEWPDGSEQTFEDVDAGQRILVTPDGIDGRVEYAQD